MAWLYIVLNPTKAARWSLTKLIHMAMLCSLGYTVEYQNQAQQGEGFWRFWGVVIGLIHYKNDVDEYSHFKSNSVFLCYST